MSKEDDVIKLFYTVSGGKFHIVLGVEEIHEHTKIPKLEILDICDKLIEEEILLNKEQNDHMLYTLTSKGEMMAKNLSGMI